MEPSQIQERGVCEARKADPHKADPQGLRALWGLRALGSTRNVSTEGCGDSKEFAFCGSVSAEPHPKGRFTLASPQ